MTEDEKIQELKNQIKILEKQKRDKIKREHATLGAILHKIGLAETFQSLTKTQILDLEKYAKSPENKHFKDVFRKIIVFSEKSDEQKTP